MKLSAMLMLFMMITGCSSTKYVADLKDFKIGIHQMGFTTPLVYIEKLKAGKSVPDIEGNKKSLAYIFKAVPNLFTPKYVIAVDSTQPYGEYYNDISRLFLKLKSSRDISSVRAGEALNGPSFPGKGSSIAL